jgi:hypothetical protein
MAYYVPASAELTALTQLLRASIAKGESDIEERRRIIGKISLEMCTIPGWLIDQWKYELHIEEANSHE